VQRTERRHTRFLGLFIGAVHAIDDPEKLGRVRAVVPSVLGSVPTRWALPIGTVGGGREGRGLVSIPPVGAMVAVFFNGGNPNAPFYLSGWWPAPNRVPKTPTPTGEQIGDPNNVVWDTEKWRIFFKNGTPHKIRIENKSVASQFIEIDGATGHMTLSVDTAKQLFLGDAGATEQAILGNAFATVYNAHTHGGVTVGAGVTGVPTPLITATQLSTKVKVAT
jgi:hypothetical protein